MKTTRKITRPFFSAIRKENKNISGGDVDSIRRGRGTANKTGMTNYVPVTLVYRSHSSRIRPRNRQTIHQDADPSLNSILIHLVIGQSLSLYLRPIL